MKPAKVDLLAEQRDAKFKKWLQEKELRDKAQEVSYYDNSLHSQFI